MAKIALASKFKLGSDELFPKAVERYIGQDFDYVITVCDHAAESCPVFPGNPERIHWSFQDPAAVQGLPEDQQRAFDRTANDIAARLRLWLALPKVTAKLIPN
jgi:arsenate reductase